MRLLLPIKERFGRIFEKRGVLIGFALLFVAGATLGIIFIRTPAIYEYHAKRCESFIDSVCFGDRNVFLVFLERLSGHALILSLLLAAGLHPIGLAVTPVIFAFRAYTFGGSLAIFFCVYRVTGALLAIAFYIPIHILLDVVFLSAISLSFGRAFSFRFCKSDLCDLMKDALLLLTFVATICLVEALFSFIFFRSIGNIL